METEERSLRPPRWVLMLALILVPAWPLGMYWLNKGYSGWSRLAAVYSAGSRELTGSRGPTSVSIVQPSGRRWEFDSTSGQRRYPETEVGFDESGFWVQARGTGWFGGPATPLFVPWDAVAECPQLRVRLRFPPVALIIHDQPLLDACRAHTGEGRGP